MTDIELESVSPEALAIVKVLEKVSEKLGNPKDCMSGESGWKMLDAIMKVWSDNYPQEVHDWIKQLEYELTVERTVQQAMKANGGYFPVSYPTRVYRMIEYFLPDQKVTDWDFMRKLIWRYPFLKTTNYKV